MNSLFVSSIIRENDVYVLVNHRRHLSVKGYKAREASNDTEHDPYAVAVLEDMERGTVGGSGCATRLLTIKPKASICSSWVGPWRLYQRCMGRDAKWKQGFILRTR